jgi:UDP-N-acetyl-D-mannosaminuronic acid transferase (WecB/TagA/CpsF family)
MSQSSALSILVFGLDPKTAQSVNDRLHARGVDSDAVAVSDTPESDAEIVRLVSSKNWNGLIVGYGVRKQNKWFERVMQIVTSTNPNVPLIHTEGPTDAENAIERHFNIQLPQTTTT